MTINLTKTQRESVEFDSGDLLLKGVPGSGKSVVLLQRALFFNQKAIDSRKVHRIIILTFTNALVKYSKELVNRTSIPHNMITISTIDKQAFSLYRKLTGNTNVKIIDSQDREQLVEAAIQKNLKQTNKKSRLHDMDKMFWVEEFLWIKQKNITTEKQYVNGERAGRGGKVRMNRSEKEIAYEIYTEYCKLLSKRKSYDWEDLYSYLISNKSKIPEAEKYHYVLVDEAQDLSFVKLKFVKMITLNSITIAADKAQKIYQTSFSWKELGIDIKGRSSKSLEQTFRSTKQIIQLAESLLEVNRALQEDQSEYTSPVLPIREGGLPTIVSCGDAVAEKEWVIKIAKKHLSNKDCIGLLYRSKNEQLILRKWLKSSGLSYEMIKSDANWSLITPGVKLSTFHSSKGLEFDVVIIPQFSNKVFPLAAVVENADDEQIEEILAQERSLLYVGMTRAKYDLYLFYSGLHSKYLFDLEPSFYRFISSEGKDLVKATRNPIKKIHEKISDDSSNKALIPEAQIATETKFDCTKVNNGALVYAQRASDATTRKFKIDITSYSSQKPFIGKSVGDSVMINGMTYIIEIIEP